MHLKKKVVSFRGDVIFESTCVMNFIFFKLYISLFICVRLDNLSPRVLELKFKNDETHKERGDIDIKKDKDAKMN